MEFKTNHCDLYPPSKLIIKEGCEIKVPEDRDFFFRAKQLELADQYTAARFFLSQTDGDNYKTWLTPKVNPKVNDGIGYIWKSYFYESALMYYNILVDLSWVLLYLSAEYVCYQDNCAIKFESVKSMGEAMELMRRAEGLAIDPLCNTNPIGYIKKMCPKLNKAVQIIVDFWKGYKESSIRHLYNYCKHRGKPAYEEIIKFKGPKLAKFNRPTDDGSMTRVAFDTREVRYKVSLEKSIEELLVFDDEELFPYLRDLIDELEKIVQPSPMVF